MLHSRKAFTIQETIIVALILSILGALAFPLGASARERSKQAQCSAQLKQVYQALLLYAHENEGYEPVASNVDIPRFALLHPDLLMPFLKEVDVFYCPDTPGCARNQLFSSYVWNAYPPHVELASPIQAARLREEAEHLGPQYAIVTCMVHDEIHFQPSERHISDSLNPPFVIELRAGGAIFVGRQPLLRNNLIRAACSR